MRVCQEEVVIMPKHSKVFLPKWMRWFIIPIVFVVWVMMTYEAFWTARDGASLGFVGWLVVSAICGLVATVVWLMSTGKLPAYLIEDDSNDPD